MSLSKKMVRSSVLGALMLAAGLAQAQTATSNLTVNATVLASCTVNAGTLTFANYSPSTGPVNNVDATANINVNCVSGTIYAVGIASNAGVGPSRTLSDGNGGLLQYELYKAATRTAGDLWGDTGTARLESQSGTGSPVAHVVHGRLFDNAANRAAAAGAYTDSVQVTVSW